jgi:hypothetical protein
VAVVGFRQANVFRDSCHSARTSHPRREYPPLRREYFFAKSSERRACVVAVISGPQAFWRKMGIVMRATMHHRTRIPYYGQ